MGFLINAFWLGLFTIGIVAAMLMKFAWKNPNQAGSVAKSLFGFFGKK